ncbi:hypothetical protein VP01_540g5 [Puccinia sorghi]|uniref:SAM domain-containing protein n=1 Tax=Puccinia sorghi TaxID=27349 RepID=A0A0L6UKJ1_9BASI|nr:hypothetical protein VP01_540g5 [Puccinia sorghi]
MIPKTVRMKPRKKGKILQEVLDEIGINLSHQHRDMPSCLEAPSTVQELHQAIAVVGYPLVQAETLRRAGACLTEGMLRNRESTALSDLDAHDSKSLRDLGLIKAGQRLRLMRLINELMGLANNFDVPDSNSKITGSLMIASGCWKMELERNNQVSQGAGRQLNRLQHGTHADLEICTPTPPTTASLIRTAITCITSGHSRTHDTISNETDLTVERFTPIKYHDSTEPTTAGMDHFSLASPMQRSKKHTPRRSLTSENAHLNLGYPHKVLLSPQKPPCLKKPTLTKIPSNPHTTLLLSCAESKGRYHLERESNSSLASPLLGASGTPACILESTQLMHPVSGNARRCID